MVINSINLNKVLLMCYWNREQWGCDCWPTGRRSG